MTPQITPDLRLDTLGMFCPVPIWETAKVMRNMQPGQVLLVLSDDEAVQGDMAAWCKQMRNELLGIDVQNGQYFCYVKKL